MKELNKNPLFVEAFRLMVRGYSVIPLKKDKRPMLGSWKQYQTTAATEEEITKWWTDTPDANVGIITGEISGITVVDIDVSGGKSVSLDTFPPTYTVKTPTNGYHLYYLYDENIKQTANTFPHLPHVDIRNTGGFVVCPPSLAEYTKGKDKISGAYTVLKDLPLAPFPAALFGVTDPKITATANQALKGFPTMAEGAGRNVAMTKVIGRILKIVPPAEHEEVAWPIALAANTRFKKPLEHSEVRTIFNSIAQKEQTKPLASVEFLRTDKGVIIANVENIYRTMLADKVLAGHFRYNTFNGTIETDFNKTQWLAFQRGDIIRVRSHLMTLYPHFTKVGHTEVEDALMRVAEANEVSPPVEYLKSLTWDKTPRLDTWLTETYGVPDDTYHRAVGSNWLKGLVNRLANPGCKFDYVLVLEGKQGIRKSTSLAILGGAWHVETVFSPDNKDFFMLFAGHSIVEFSEGETLSRTEAKKLKAVITMQHDKYRPPYERSSKDFPRQCVFAMTTNQEEYLKDETGNRRWLPISIKQQANTDWLQANRDQLYAEAYHRVVTLKETTHEFPEEETLAQQAARQIGDPREEIIYEWYYTTLEDSHRKAGVTTRMAYLGAIQGGYGGGAQMERKDETIIGAIFKNILKLERQRSMVKGTRVYLYFPSAESEAAKPDAQEATIPSNMEF